MSHARPGLTTCSQYDAALHALSAARQRWAETSVNRRLALLRQIKDALASIAPAWVEAAARAKGLPAGDPLTGEEWLAGPCALMVGCNGLIATLEQLVSFLGPGKTFCAHAPGAVEPLGSAMKYFRSEFEAGVKAPHDNHKLFKGIQPNLLGERW